jgi:hypothetical protein
MEGNTGTMRLLGCVLVLLGLVGGCEITIEPGTGETSAQLTLPGTAGYDSWFDERWRQCTQYKSESVCEQEFGGQRPQRSN